MSMRARKDAFRYDTSGRWYKGNTHVHSTASDGGKTPAELAELYAGAGYHFLFATDHWVASDVRARPGAFPLLWLDGIEIDDANDDGGCYHVVCLGKVTGITREKGFVRALKSARRQGALIILAHPYWCENSIEEALRWEFDGVEIYNHVCHWLNGKGDGRMHWSAMLRRDARTLGLATDDTHARAEHPGWNGGWIMVNAANGSRHSIMAAIRRGNFYSSCGPAFKSIAFKRGAVHIRTSPVQFVRLVGPRCEGQRCGSFDGKTLTEASFRVPPDWTYAYLEIEDRAGKRAWTNALFDAPSAVR